MEDEGNLSKRVFLEAARMVAEGEKEFSCLAINYACYKFFNDWRIADEERKKFVEIMLDGKANSPYFFIDDKRNLRVIALCFMAAMED